MLNTLGRSHRCLPQTCVLYNLRWHAPTYYFPKFSLIFLYDEIKSIYIRKRRKKGYVSIVFFSEFSTEIMTMIILAKNSKYLKFTKASGKKSFLMVYIVTYQQNTFQLKILCLKFVEFYIVENFES